MELAVREVDDARVIDFRLQWLLSVGYKTANAELIAEDLSIDWHLAVKLRKQCEDEKLCMRVLFGNDIPRRRRKRISE